MFAPLCLLLMLVVGSLLSLVFELDLATLMQVLQEPELHFAIAMSVGTALLSLLLALLIGIPAAWVMARTAFRGKGIIDALLDIPLVTPPLIVGIGLLLLLGQRGPAERYLSAALRAALLSAGRDYRPDPTLPAR